jgi:hypothetical protein
MSVFIEMNEHIQDLIDRIRRIKRKARNLSELDDGPPGTYTDPDWIVHVPGSGYGMHRIPGVHYQQGGGD